MFESLYISILIAGFGGGVVRGLVGFVKHQFAYKNVSFKLPYFLGMIFISGVIGILTAVAIKELGLTFFGLSQLTPALAIEIVVLLALAFGGFLLWLSQKRKRWIKENRISYEVKSGEDIKSLAERFDVSWKLVAKINKLQPPYALKSKDKIKMPPASK